ncbi:single-stranded DNA-binding protein [Streptomyces sp. NPDC001904]|uniref:single-stranded DNA-binding protein n=1 Tax=Streptomyces sp. NPDC001904 TaxID=3154531 RepID=UPI003319DA98
MNGQTTATIHGRVHGTVQLRLTASGTDAARFWILQFPAADNRDTDRPRQGDPVPFICTVQGAAARHAAETLTDAVHVIATGELRVSPSPQASGTQLLFLDNARVGVDLSHHVAYIDATLPAVLAGHAATHAA